MDALNKYRIIEKIIETEDDSLLEEINLLLGISSEKADVWNSVPAGVKETISKSMLELKEGKVLTNEDVLADIKKRFLKDV